MSVPETAKTFLPIGELVNWDKNPRNMNVEDCQRLKKQILKLGQYKPLVVTVDGAYKIVLGGNMRLQAMRELVAEGHKDFEKVWVSYVEAGTEAERLQYALSDNDRIGRYDEKALTDLARDAEGFDLGDYYVDMGEPMPLDVMLDLDDADEIEVDESRLQILRVFPPESPSLKEKAVIKIDDIEAYERIKEAVEEGRINAQSLLNLL